MVLFSCCSKTTLQHGEEHFYRAENFALKGMNTQPITGVSLPLHTDNGEELVGAAVREEAAHCVPTWEGGQTFLAVLMGLEVGMGKEQSKCRWALTLILLATIQDLC